MSRWNVNLAIAFIIFLSISLMGQGLDDEDESYGRPNGVYYLKRERQARIDLLYGIQTGIGLLMDEKVISEEKWDLYTIKGFRFGDFADQIDKLYEDKANLRIPIAYAYLYAIRRARGVPPDEIDDFLAALRRRFLKR